MFKRNNGSEAFTHACELIQSLFPDIHITEARLLGERKRSVRFADSPEMYRNGLKQLRDKLT